MTLVGVLTVLGRTAVGNGGVTAPSHAALRVLMVLPTWPVRSWAGLILVTVISGIACAVVGVVVGTRDRTRSGINADRLFDTSDLGKGRTKKR
jgi:hypothetical protein